MTSLSYAEERLWQDKVHNLSMLALEAKRVAVAEERIYREYIKEKYGTVPKAVA